jgi:hypothetical protein
VTFITHLSKRNGEKGRNLNLWLAFGFSAALPFPFWSSQISEIRHQIFDIFVILGLLESCEYTLVFHSTRLENKVRRQMKMQPHSRNGSGCQCVVQFAISELAVGLLVQNELGLK